MKNESGRQPQKLRRLHVIPECRNADLRDSIDHAQLGIPKKCDPREPCDQNLA